MAFKNERSKKATVNLLMAVGSLAVCIAIALVSITPQTYDISVGEISNQTITAPKDVVDEVTTQAKIEEAQAQVGPSYKKDADITQQSSKKLSEDFAAFEKARAQAQSIYEQKEQEKADAVQQEIDKVQQANAAQTDPVATPAPVPTPYTPAVFDPANVEWDKLLTQEQITEIKDILPDYIDSTQFYHILSMTAKQLSNLQEAVSGEVENLLSKGITSDELDQTKSDAIQDIEEKLDLTETMRSLMVAVISNDLTANVVFDETATKEARDKAAALVTPKMYKSGQNIVVKGEIVGDAEYGVLKSLGLLSTESTSIRPYFGIILYIVLAYVLYAVFLAVFNRRLLMNTKKIAILAILTAAAYGATALAQLVAIHIFPIFLFVILGAVLLSPKNALLYSVFLSLLLVSVTTGGQEMFSEASLMLLLITMMGSFFAVYTLKDMRYRSRLVLGGLTAAIPGVVVVLIVWMLQVPIVGDQAPNVQQLLNSMAMLAISGVMCGIISIGVLPLLENAFKLTTPTKLLELSDPTHPLTKRLMIEAPGTYHHSILVANLAEAGCNAVGGFALLARVGAYFHDVGKVENPLFFKENQRNNVNPHDKIEPKDSAAIIRKHVPDGVAMLKKYKMPGEIIDIVRNHHGNGTVGYFYYEALKQDENTDIEDYRYAGSPPDTKEGAIVMLADIVEAAVRSLDDPSREEISDMVHKLIKARYDEGLLDRTPLNRRDLRDIAEAFINIFDGVYHQRIKYPDIKIHGAEDEDHIL
ncbi:MAG: HDIG domain-containing protein [Christensenella sp.]|uniref:HD family phosphohydrolase n=1 Tax=Christensenella sp. TaxID=1935934 RepID=UPI002B21EFCA|nr:HDIG domain-containing metalloprotein [Christensenella sp.]MEA5002397.1 HDIG domain-containing protein [Christensenella sp.]